MMRRELALALTTARDLHAGEGYDSPEYTRGQVELICDMFSIPPSCIEDVHLFLTHAVGTFPIRLDEADMREMSQANKSGVSR